MSAASTRSRKQCWTRHCRRLSCQCFFLRLIRSDDDSLNLNDVLRERKNRLPAKHEQRCDRSRLKQPDQEKVSRTEAARRPYRDYGERSFHCVRLAGTYPKTPPPVLPGSFVNASFRFGGVRDVLFVCSSACFAAGFRLNHHL